ncbi:MAG: HAMP domain-containing histidine kinase [Gemmatimonadota bacterium]|nr:MAG: HAMP domain-containing histidine kinase [Gemmatimonadota bacterium]
MPNRSKLQRRHSSRTILLVSLLVIVALSLWLGYNAIATARSHDETVDGALRDYSSMAAWEFSRRARENLDWLLWNAFEQVPGRTRDRDLPSPSVIASELGQTLRRLRCECRELRRPLVYFRADLQAASLTAIPDTFSRAVLQLLADSIISRQRAEAISRIGLMNVDSTVWPDVKGLAAYNVVNDRSGRPRALYGFVTDARAYDELFDRWFGKPSLLPPAIAGEEPNDSLLFVVVYTEGGARTFESAVEYPTTYGVRDTMGLGYGGLVVEAAVRPDVADHLIIGGLPRSRLPLIFVLLFITLGVGAAALLQLRREHQLARLREDFVSGVSHELRTPLAQIRMFAELLEAGKLRTDAERDRSMGVINREARRLTHLVENILQFSRSGRATVDLKIQRLDIDRTIQAVVEAFKPIASSQDVDIEVAVPPGLSVRADRDALSQILLNLLDNAVKYGPHGQTILVEASQELNRLRLWVQDEGPGIPQQHRTSIWEPYRRLTNDEGDTSAGTGIGLAVVDELVALHDGRVRIEDAPGGGARFVVELPGASTQAVHPGSTHETEA